MKLYKIKYKNSKGIALDYKKMVVANNLEAISKEYPFLLKVKLIDEDIKIFR